MRSGPLQPQSGSTSFPSTPVTPVTPHASPSQEPASQPPGRAVGGWGGGGDAAAALQPGSGAFKGGGAGNGPVSQPSDGAPGRVQQRGGSADELISGLTGQPPSGLLPSLFSTGVGSGLGLAEEDTEATILGELPDLPEYVI